MAGFLPKQRDQFHKIPNARLAIIGSMWHAECVDGMIERARKELLGVQVKPENISIHHIPGSLEIPYAARILFETDPSLDAILAFGVVLQGSTTHDLTVLQQVVHDFGIVSDRFGKPIINEVIGVTSIEDAQKRSSDTEWNKGYEAVFAVTELLHWKQSIVGPKK